MSAEMLRRAAALMRERAEGARAGRWSAVPSRLRADATLVVSNWTEPVRVAECSGSLPQGNKASAEHIASWHPAVALTVADWLDVAADHFDPGGEFLPVYAEALALARAYLGESA